MSKAEKTAGPRRQALVLLMQLFRRAVDQGRAYGKTHQLAVTALERFREHFSSVATEELTLEITLGGAALDGELLAGRPGQRDPLTLPLFNEGIRRLTVTANPPAHERDAFFDAWMQVVANPSEAEALSTRVWELELEAFRLVVLDTFSLSDDEGGSDDGSQNQQKAKQELDSLINAMAAESTAGSADGGPALLRVSADDVALLRSELVRGVTGESLAQQDAKLAALHLSPTDIENFVLGFTPRADAVPAAARAIINAAVLSQGEEAGAFARRLADLFAAFAERGRFHPTLEAWKWLVADARADTHHGAVRVKLLTWLKQFFVSPAFLDPLLRTLDGAEGNAPDALEALRTIAPTLGNGFKDQVARLTSPAARAAASALLAEIAPTQGTRAINVADLNAASFAEFIKRLDAMPPADATRLITQGLDHADVEVRRQAAASITPTVAVRLPRGVLTNHLKDVDADVRATLLKVVTDLEDPSAARALGELLKRADVAEAERTRVYHALGKLGGRVAVDVLIAELDRRQDPDATVAAVGALAVLGDPRSAKPLEALAGRLMSTPRVKSAARAAISRVKKA